METLELMNSTGRSVPCRKPSGWVFVLMASLASFVAYTCAYGFRKPFTASSYEGYELLGISYKSILVIVQVLGYMSGKFFGIKFIATIQPKKRGIAAIGMVGVAWFALLLFAVIPPPYNFLCLFLNGFPLATIWGLVFGYLEGRRVTEIVGAILTTSIIFASGLAKTVGKLVMIDWHVCEWWMPFAAGALFVVPLLISIAILDRLPSPDDQDIVERTLRKPMDKTERKQFLQRFGIALIPIIVAYGMLTILRDFCEDFANELWKEVGLGQYAGIFVNTSTVVAVIVLSIVVFFFFIKDNYNAFRLNHIVITLGFVIAIIATILFSFHALSPVVWMVAAMCGLYLGYMPYNCFYFERMLATYKVQGNVGFVMYIADAFGYLGTVIVLLVKELTHLNYSWVKLFQFLFYTASGIGIVLVAIGYTSFRYIYIGAKKKSEQ